MDVAYSYKMIKSSWGIKIDLIGSATPIPINVDGAREVIPGLWLKIEDPIINDIEKEYLALGIKLVQDQIRNSDAFGEGVVISVKKILYIPTDYQPEGIVCAICGWAAIVFGFKAREFSVQFDRAANRYLFEF